MKAPNPHVDWDSSYDNPHVDSHISQNCEVRFSPNLAKTTQGGFAQVSEKLPKTDICLA